MQDGPASLDGDDDVGDQEEGLQGKDDRSDVAALPTVPKHLDRGHEAVFLAQRPGAGADQQEGQGNDERRGGAHQAISDDPVVEGVPRGPQDGEGGHVGPGQREEKDEGAQGTAGQKIVFSRVPGGRAAKGENSDV